MADYKDYIVRYDIVADVTKAAEGLQAIANIAKEFEGPMNALKTAITRVSQSAYQLKQNSQITFAPKIDVGAFNNQLRAMVTQVRSAAAEMHAAIFEALSGNASATKVAQKGIGTTLGGKKTVAALKKDIEDYNKELDKLLGTPKKNSKGGNVRNRDGAIQMTKNALAKGSVQVQQQMQERLLKLEAQKRMFQKLIQERKAELAVAEKMEKEAAAQQAKAAKSSTPATTISRTATSQPAKLTNVTPAVIREWKKAFGDAKSKALTVNIRGNATGAGGALTVIEQIQASLKALQAQGTFNINPILNTEGFAAAEAQLRQLASLSAAVVAPFAPKDNKTKPGKAPSLVSTLTKDEKTKLTNAQKQIKAWNEKIAPIQSRLDANKAIPEDQRTPAIKGQITRDTKKLAAYQANKAEQESIVRSLQGKSAAAVKTATTAAKPLALDIVGNLSKINVTAKAPVVPVVGEITKLQGKVSEAIPVNVRIMSDQVAASVKAVTPTPILDVRVNLLKDGIQQQLQAISAQTKPVTKSSGKSTAPTTAPAAPKPVYTPPVFTAADEKQLNSLYSKYGALSTAQEKAAKAMAAAHQKLEKSGGSERAFDRYRAASKEYGNIRSQYLDVQKQLQPLMFKQFQSTAQRALTNEEIQSGLKAQSIVDQLSKKKRLTAEQKAQMSEANKTLAALRAPAPATPPTSSVTPTISTPAKEPVVKTPKGKKAASTAPISGKVDTKDIISQINNIPRQTIPVAVKLMWEKGAVGRQEQIKKLAGNIPPIPLNFDTSAALTKLEDFVAKVRAASPQNIKLTASGTPAKATPAPATTKSPKTPAPVATPASSKAKTPAVSGAKKSGVVDPTKSLAQTKLPPITLQLDTSAATAALEGFIAKVKAASPQNIKLTASGMSANTPTQNVVTPIAPTSPAVAPISASTTTGTTQKSGKQSGHTGHQPLSSLERYNKIKNQSEERARKQLADNRFRTIKRQEYNTQQQTWYNQQQALYNKLFGAASKPDPNWAYRQEQQRAGELAKMQEDARAAFAKPTPFEQKEAMAQQTAVAQSIAKHERQANTLRAKAQNAMLPFAQSKGQLDLLTKYRKFFKDAVKTTGIIPQAGMVPSEELRYLQGVSSLMQKANVSVPWQLQDQINQHTENIAKQEVAAREAAEKTARLNSIAQKQQKAAQLRAQARNAILPWVSNESQLNTVLNNRRFFREAIATTGINPMSPNTTSAQRLQYYHGVADQMRANNAPIPWQLEDQIQKLTAQQLKNAEIAAKAQQKADATTRHEESKRSIARHQQQAERLRAQAQNAMLPFAQNKEQLNMLTKHRRFFRQAVATTGIMPTPGMEAPQMLKYLQGVSSQMQQSSVAVPWQLQSQINKLEGDVAKSKGIGEPTAPRRSGMTPMPVRQKPFFDRSRRWAYPFTGQTSFGVRTPMAVDMAKGMGVMFAIGGAMSAIGSSFSQAMEYQNTMRTTQAILQNGTDTYSQNSFRNMEETVRNVGVKTKFSAPEVASAARFLAMAGYDIDAINASIRPIADLALIGDSDLGETADKMTNIMTTFQIAPERMREAANIMATTATRSNTDLMMLAESAKYGGGVANMYGRNDPHLFADTMALFGVMGNAGIQASSAGTALRMMYQNIFKPNKNQKAVLDMMKQSYGITTLKEDGSYRSISDILIDMAQRIPENQMAQIVGNLFRITAQPGAAATLLAAAGGDKGVAQEIGTGIEAVSAKMSSKAGMSSLVSLMLANRNSANGNISGAIAEEKQNTISGLWAQVTSTFTEGIVQAFENRQGGFEEMLRKLRDYLAKPETIQMMQNLLDMIIEIGKVMAWFVKIWASLYNAAPGLIKFWVTFQMGITQMGALIAPIISLIGVFDRLKGSILTLAGISTAGGAVSRGVAGSVAAGTAANAAIANTPFIVGSGKFGTNKVIRGNIATRAHNTMAANAILAGELALSGANKQTTLAALNKETRQHYAAVRERATRIYGPARAGRAFKAAFYAVPTMASFAPMFGGLKSMLMGLLTGLAKAAGFLVNPVTSAVGAVAGLGYGLYKLKQRIDGTTEAQQRAGAQANKAADQTYRELTKEGQWYQDMMSENIPEAIPVISSVDTTQIEKYDAAQQRFNQLYATIFNDFSKDARKQSINDVTTRWRNVIAANPAYSLAIGNAHNYDFSKKHRQMEYNPYNDAGNLGVALWNLWHADEDTAINQRNGMVQDALMIEGANDLRTQQAIREIAELRRKYLAGETTYKSESEYQQAAFAIRDKYMSQYTAKLPSAGMTPEQFQQTSNRSVYDMYQLGAQNLLDATINGQMGTLVGKMNAYQWLYNTENQAKQYTDDWYNAIANIIGDYRVIYNAVSADGRQQANIQLMLSTLPNGQLNFTNILEQIRAKVTNFNMTIQGFSDVIGSAYKLMAEAGVINITDTNSLKEQIRHQLTGAKYGDKTPREYWKQWIAKNDNSEWIKAGINERQYVDFIMGRSGETLNLGNRIVSRSHEQQMMYNNIAKRTAKTIIDQNQHLTDKAKELSNNTGSKSTPTPTPPPVKDQQAYASAYDRSAARPTQVVFNINNLASFDRTTVASSAEERDLIATMEERIAGAVYTMFAEASNQAQRVMDLT